MYRALIRLWSLLGAPSPISQSSTPLRLPPSRAAAVSELGLEPTPFRDSPPEQESRKTSLQNGGRRILKNVPSTLAEWIMDYAIRHPAIGVIAYALMSSYGSASWAAIIVSRLDCSSVSYRRSTSDVMVDTVFSSAPVPSFTSVPRSPPLWI